MEPIEASARLVLKKNRERPLLQGHHWIYSGAVLSASGVSAGALAEVYSQEQKKLGCAMLGAGHSIVGHMLAFGEQTPLEALRQRLEAALSLRKRLFSAETNAYRLVNAEGDGLPGLIVDSYNGALVMQLSHPGMELMRSHILRLLIECIEPRSIFEKSTSFLRAKEGMEQVRAHHYGDPCSRVEVREEGLRYEVDLLEGQKTGLFLDQRETRQLVRRLALGRRVINCFAYTGGFSVAALAGGAAHVDSVEISAKCAPAVDKNIALNDLDARRHRFFTEDAIDFVAQRPLDCDLLILDPPAFVKKKKDIDVAFRAYKDLNRTVLEKLPAGSLLLTCSCSYHVGEELFQNILFRACREAKRKAKILTRHRQAFDHPISLFHPEGSYLKSLLLYVC
jgi:23S rRNA (cytosine1962-C5)-methyltransferase